ncbi:MAG: hypothetical protein VX481_05980, partial [Cyanobacteriota bacterium]|nr:hypothetical protein [Cyanobacteriota bacterium]
MRNTAPLAPTPPQVFDQDEEELVDAVFQLAEGSLFPDAAIAAFGDVDLGGPLTDLYLGGQHAGMVSYDPVFALPGMPESEVAARSALPSLAMVTLYNDIHLLVEEGLERSQLDNPNEDRRPSLLPGPFGDDVLDSGNTFVHRDFSLVELIGTPIVGRSYQIQAFSEFTAQLGDTSNPTALAMRLQVLDANGQLINRLQDDDNQLTSDLSSDHDVFRFIWTENMAGARLRVAPAVNFADDASLQQVEDQLADSAFRLQVGILDTPALDEGSATWADIDNDGDVDLLLSGSDPTTGLLTTQLLRNPLVGGGSSFERLSIALPGLQRSVASWGDLDLDGDLDLAITGVQGSDELPYLQIFRNTTSQRLNDSTGGEPPFSGTLNRRPDRPEAVSVQWNGGHEAVQLGWTFSHLLNDDAPYSYNLGIGRAPRDRDDRVAPGEGHVFDMVSPLADPLSGERRLAAAGNQGFHNAGLFSAGLPGETYHWSVQAVDKGFRGSVWADGADFTVQPLQPLLDDARRLISSPVDAPLPDHIESSEAPDARIIESDGDDLVDRIGLISISRPVVVALSDGIDSLEESQTLIVDLDSDGLSDRIQYDADSLQLSAEQGYGANGELYRPFLGFTGALIPDSPDFLAYLPANSADVNLTSVDRSFQSADATGQWTLSVDGTEWVSFRSGDPLSNDLDLTADLVTRQRYRLNQVPTDVTLFLNGVDVRGKLTTETETETHANLSFTLEDARSGALGFKFKEPASPAAGDITLDLVPVVNGSGGASYQLRLQDLGDGRPDLLLTWTEGSTEHYALIENDSVRGNQAPAAPVLVGLERDDTSLLLRWQPGSDTETPQALLRHQWRLLDADGDPSAWQDLPAGSAVEGLLIDVVELQALQADALEPGTSLSLQLRVIDAGEREALSAVSELSVAATPAPDTRPELLGIRAISLSEGNSLQHRGTGVIPLQLRQRLDELDPGTDFPEPVDTATINLQLPDWLQEVGSFVLLNDDGSTAEAPAAVDVADSNLRALPLQADQLERLAFIPTR